MARVIITTAADADTNEILNDLTTKAGLPTATKYERLFDKLIDLLADYPAIGAPRPALGPHVRISIVLPYIVIYSHNKDDDTVTLLRILYGRRNITRALVGEEN